MTPENQMPEKPNPRSRRRGALLVSLLVSLVLAGSWCGWQWRHFLPDDQFSVSASIAGVDRQIQVDVFLPGNAGSAHNDLPAIALLHGVEGAERYRAAHFRTARWLADQGFAVYFVHYFDGVDYPDLWLLRDDGELDTDAIDQACRNDAEKWTAAATAALRSIAARPEVDAARIVLDGNSLGGFVALSAVAEARTSADIPDPCAVVVNWGALFATTRIEPGFPPTLFVHGELDEIVPVKSARSASEAIRSVGSEATLFVVPGASHVARSHESDALTMGFLSRHAPPAGAVAASQAAAPVSKEMGVDASLLRLVSPFFQ